MSFVFYAKSLCMGLKQGLSTEVATTLAIGMKEMLGMKEKVKLATFNMYCGSSTFNGSEKVGIGNIQPTGALYGLQVARGSARGSSRMDGSAFTTRLRMYSPVTFSTRQRAKMKLTRRLMKRSKHTHAR